MFCDPWGWVLGDSLDEDRVTCNKRIVIVPNRAETYCQRDAGHTGECSIKKDKSPQKKGAKA